jgi:hypothetical protein
MKRKRRRRRLIRAADEAELKRQMKAELTPMKLLLECWNEFAPHGDKEDRVPHQYKLGYRCVYCGRPDDWEPVDVAKVASEIVYGSYIEEDETGSKR